MDEKTLQTLEYFKILERLASYAAFPASVERARGLRPSTEIEDIQRLQAETSEALQLQLSHSDLTIGGARDVRASIVLAVRGGVLDPGELLDIKYTLVAARNLVRMFERLSSQAPNLAAIVFRMTIPPGIIEAITRTLSERGEILDSASVKLATIRHDQRIVYDRLMTKLQRMISDPKNAPFLQEAIITQRDGRYVIPLRAEFKGRIRSIIHDQSSSGATLFVEPVGVVDQNNQYRELLLAERDEERRILAELSDLVASCAEMILNNVEVIADLDLALARGKYAEDIQASEPIVTPIKTKSWTEPVEGKRHPGSAVRLFQARHPLLDPKTVVPVDVELDSQTYALVVTGPNTGGKTVTLKTIGLLSLMALSGLHIPALAGSEISLFETIYADIGDEQSIEQSLSTFSSHITNIKRILEKANRRSLVILDELGAGTDPTEGAALARAILSHLLLRGITTLVTTHHPELKAFAHATEGVVNASVEFDIKSLKPTFNLTIGLPGRSNALAIAQRLGLPKTIIEQARTELDPNDIRAEDLLDEIHRQRDIARNARSSADRARSQAENLRNDLLKRLESIEDERMKILETARLEAEAEMKALKDELREVRKSLAKARQPVEALEPVEAQIHELEAIVQLPVERMPEKVDLPQTRSLRLGDKVRLRNLGTQGIVTALGEDEVEVSMGSLRVRTRLGDLEWGMQSSGEQLSGASRIRQATDSREKRTQKESTTRAEAGPGATLPASPGFELDLRGQRADDALEILDRYLDSAYLAGLPFVRIIHGKGTGRLREVVHAALNQHAHIRSFELGGEKEGGEGVTVARLAAS
jgi:DNA mismatch repair protein MutS2